MISNTKCSKCNTDMALVIGDDSKPEEYILPLIKRTEGEPNRIKADGINVVARVCPECGHIELISVAIQGSQP